MTHCAATHGIIPGAPAPRVGLVVLGKNHLILSIDTTARVAVGLELSMVNRAMTSLLPKLLDADGRPLRPGETPRSLAPGSPLEAVRATRWLRDRNWSWLHARYLAHESTPNRVHVEVHSIPRPEAFRQRGWTCSACDDPTTAVVDVNGRELCLDCWVETAAFRASGARDPWQPR